MFSYNGIPENGALYIPGTIIAAEGKSQYKTLNLARYIDDFRKFFCHHQNYSSYVLQNGGLQVRNIWEDPSKRNIAHTDKHSKGGRHTGDTQENRLQHRSAKA